MQTTETKFSVKFNNYISFHLLLTDSNFVCFLSIFFYLNTLNAALKKKVRNLIEFYGKITIEVC